MPSIHLSLGRRRRQAMDMRLEMIAQTSAFLTWALSEERGLPRIPSRPVELGGFDELSRHPAGRKLAAAWWGRALTQGWRE